LSCDDISHNKLTKPLQVGFRRAEIASLKVGDFHMNRGFDSLQVVRKGGKKRSLAIHPQAAQRIKDYWRWQDMVRISRDRSAGLCMTTAKALRHAGPCTRM
jgi:integrase